MSSLLLDDKQVERIKKAVLKYINAQLLPREKVQTNDPKSPNRTLSPNTSKRSSRAVKGIHQPSTPSPLYRKPSKPNSPLSAASKVVQSQKQKSIKKQSIREKDQGIGTPPHSAGLLQKKRLNKNRSQDSLTIKKNKMKLESKAETTISQLQNKKVPSEFTQNILKFVLDKEVLPSILQQKIVNLEEQLQLDKKNQKSLENKQYLIEFNKTNKKQTQVIKVDNSSVVSVSQIAKRFGGTTVKKQQKKVDLKVDTGNRRNIYLKRETQKTESNNDQESKSYSVASFGGNDKNKISVKNASISDYLGVKNENEGVSKIRKRSNTLQETKQNNLFRSFQDNNEKSQKINSQSDKRSLRTATFESPDKNPKNQRASQNQRNQLKFTNQEENVLKRKYNVLLLKLNQLKQRVKYDYENQIKPKQYNPKKASQRKRQAEMLYHKYSPLKQLQKVRRQKSLRNSINLARPIKNRQFSQQKIQQNRNPSFQRSLHFEIS